MVADTFKLTGRLEIRPTLWSTDKSMNPSIESEVCETLSLKQKLSSTIVLDADGAEAVNLADLPTAALIVIRSSGKVIVTLTCADGVAQTIAVDPFALIMSTSVPYTAISLTRIAGVSTTVRIILGTKADA